MGRRGFLCFVLQKLWGIFNVIGFPCGLAGKESPAMWETWVLSLGYEDPLEKGTATHSSMATHSSILAWRIPSTV